MLPPIEDAVLQNNPNFAALHARLANDYLNPDGSSKNQPAQGERDTLSAAWKTARKEAAENELIRASLSSMDLVLPSTSTKSRSRGSISQPDSKALPPELLELVILLSARLSASTSASAIALLESSPQYELLPDYLPTIGSLISNHLHTNLLSLLRLLHPTTNPSYLHRQIAPLPATLHALAQRPSLGRANLHASHLALLTLTTNLLSSLNSVTLQTITLLETTKHSFFFRHITSYSAYLSLLSQFVALELREKYYRGERMVYTDDVKRALGNYKQEVRMGRERLKERKREREKALRGYGVGTEEVKEKQMKEIARVYGEMEREIEEVGRDVRRLNGA